MEEACADCQKAISGDEIMVDQWDYLCDPCLVARMVRDGEPPVDYRVGECSVCHKDVKLPTEWVRPFFCEEHKPSSS